MPRILPPSPCTAREFHAMAVDLEAIAARLRAVATLVEADPESEPLYCFMRQTMDIGLRHVRNFADEAETSWRAHSMGHPIHARSVKGRANQPAASQGAAAKGSGKGSGIGTKKAARPAKKKAAPARRTRGS